MEVGGSAQHEWLQVIVLRKVSCIFIFQSSWSIFSITVKLLGFKDLYFGALLFSKYVIEYQNAVDSEISRQVNVRVRWNY